MVPLALIFLPLASQPGEVALEEVLCHLPREAWPLTRVLSDCLVNLCGRGSDPLLLWWLVVFIEALVLFPNIEREGIPQRPI